MTTPYDFRTQLANGERGEAFLDAFFRRAYAITPATTAEQRMGIDRHFVNLQSGATLTVEYKTDAMASRTHNAFIETISVDRVGKSGWAYTSQADWLVYFVPGDELMYLIRFIDLRKHLPKWALSFPTKEAQNDGYKTLGLIVPLEFLERCATTTFTTHKKG